jgi:NAD(P)-dependent dehydrogenase (short-subunit alcohol dehydrogenase family)
VLLGGKNAVIYGGGGSIGSAVARVFAREGARVFLAGRTGTRVEAVARGIRSTGGTAEQLDALDERAVDDHADAVAARAWRAAARHMARQGSGVMLSFGGEGHPVRDYHLGSLQTSLHAVESMRRQLASELGVHGVRVVTLRT